jgi:hypothetical protein
MSRPNWYCANCGTIAPPERMGKGSILVALLLLCLFIVPGLIYLIWWQMSKEWRCPKCFAPHMLPLTSPKAIEALQRLNADQAAGSVQSRPE